MTPILLFDYILMGGLALISAALVGLLAFVVCAEIWGRILEGLK